MWPVILGQIADEKNVHMSLSSMQTMSDNNDYYYQRQLCAPRLFSLVDAFNSMWRIDTTLFNYSNALQNNRRSTISAKCKRLKTIYISERVTNTGIDPRGNARA